MEYRAIGLMSGSSLDGLDIVFARLQEIAGSWTYEVLCSECIEYTTDWKSQLKGAVHLPALEYQLLHASYGHFLGTQVNRFIETNDLQHKVALIASHGHTTFHEPLRAMTAQLGDGAAIAAETGLAVVSDLRSMDVALGGQGAPIVPLGEKILFSDHSMFLNIGGIANISFHRKDEVIAFDVCPANAILNQLAQLEAMDYDEDGRLASSGVVHPELLLELSSLNYYKLSPPKSLSNNYGMVEIIPILEEYNIGVADLLSTYCEHIAEQVRASALPLITKDQTDMQIFTTGGGAFNKFLVERLRAKLKENNISITIPGDEVIKYKEALIMALLGVLRWREENTVLASVTGARMDSIGGALWLGNH